MYTIPTYDNLHFQDYYLVSDPGKSITARYVRYVSPNGGMGNIAELTIFGTTPPTINLALDKPASQSSILGGIESNASKSNDGEVSTFNHTWSNGAQWLRINLKKSYDLTSLEIVNRGGTIQQTGIGSVLRLNGARVVLKDRDMNVIYKSDPITNATRGGVINYTPTLAHPFSGVQYIEVRHNNQFIHVAEIRAYGTETKSAAIPPVFKIKNRGTSRLLEIKGGYTNSNTENGDYVIQWDDQSSPPPDSFWELSQEVIDGHGGAYYKIRNRSTKRILEIKGGYNNSNTENGNYVIQWDDHNEPDAFWEITEEGEDERGVYYKIKNRGTNRIIATRIGVFSDQFVGQWDNHNDYGAYSYLSPFWYLVPVESSSRVSSMISLEKAKLDTNEMSLTNEEPVHEFSIHPNPTNDELTISFANTESNRIELLDTYGRVLYTKTVNDVSKHVISTKKLQLSTGVYFVNVISKEGVVRTKKVLVEKN